MKKLNLKLTAFLVSLFIGLMLIILGSKVKICFSFGFMVVGFSLVIYVLYSAEKTQKFMIDVHEKLEQSSENDEFTEDEKIYVLTQLSLQQKRLKKQQKRINILFSTTAFLLIIMGFVNMF